jgi:hypothetical protein
MGGVGSYLVRSFRPAGPRYATSGRARADARGRAAPRPGPIHGSGGAISEHLADAFKIMTRPYAAGDTATQSNSLIGAGLFGPGIQGIAIRSMLIPGTAYADKWLGRDPQPGQYARLCRID